MSVQNHPQYELEQQRLDFTKRYIQAVIKTAETSQERFRENIKDAFVDLDWLDSSLSYINILTNAKFLEMSSEDIENLKRIQPKPYFAKIHFKRERTEQDNQVEEYYIGKTSLYQRETQDPIIVDWRSPVANLYYDGRLGEVSYEAEGYEYHGFLSQKRQFVIEGGSLEDIRDVDLTTRDELLQQSLSESASNRLTDIVATIQEEQNRIIRADLNRPIIVQGAAGSGKTTIALHRISFFIYTYAEHFQPEQLMILAPNNLFIDYISEALPELGVEKVRQTTFTDYVKECIGKNVKIKSADRFSHFSQKGNEELEMKKWCIAFRGSLTFLTILKKYVNDVVKNLYPMEDFKVDKFQVYSAKRFKRLLLKEYTYLPIYSRIDKIKKVISNDFQSKKKKMIEKVTDFYDEKLENALYNIQDAELRKKKVSHIMDRKEQRLNELHLAMKGAVANYMKQFPKYTLLEHYKLLFQSPDLLVQYSKGTITKRQAEYLCTSSLETIRKNTYEEEDLAALLYLQYALFGIDKEFKAKNVIIDEAQDYSLLQFAVLKLVLETDMITIVGDMAQGIHSYRSIGNWNDVQRIFPRASYHELQKSYRTTIEIMNLANQLLKKLPLELPMVEPVVRHGDLPLYIKIDDSRHCIEEIKHHAKSVLSSGFKTIAIITKTDKDANFLYSAFKKDVNLSVQLLQEHEQSINKESIVIVPSYVSKGLEFDAVLVVSLNEVFLPENDIDIKLLYVAMTRPLHRLILIGKKTKDLLLDEDGIYRTK